MNTRLLLPLLCTAVALSAACGGGKKSSGAMPPENCSQDPRGMTYAPGMNVAGDSGVLSLTLDTATPAPPDIGDNDWAMTTLDAGGAPVNGCSMVVTPTMPDMQHGTYPPPVAAAMDSAGDYSVTPVNLFMGGYWEVKFEISCPAGNDVVTYKFCLDG